MSKNLKAEPGLFARDKITKFEGIIDHRAEFPHSQPMLCIKPCKLDKDGKVIESIFVDEAQCEVIAKKGFVATKCPAPKFPWLAKVRDPITETIGKITGRATYLNGCARIAIQQTLVEGKVLDAQWFPEERIELIEAPRVEVQQQIERKVGGPNPRPSRRVVG